MSNGNAHLSATQLQELRADLEDLRRAYLKEFGLHKKYEAEIRERREVGDHEDVARETSALELELSLEHHDRTLLAEVRAALARREDGSYGVCEETGEPIPYKRLKAVPMTRVIAEVAEAREQDEAMALERREADEDRLFGYYAEIADDEAMLQADEPSGAGQADSDRGTPEEKLLQAEEERLLADFGPLPGEVEDELDDEEIARLTLLAEDDLRTGKNRPYSS